MSQNKIVSHQQIATHRGLETKQRVHSPSLYDCIQFGADWFSIASKSVVLVQTRTLIFMIQRRLYVAPLNDDTPATLKLQLFSIFITNYYSCPRVTNILLILLITIKF